MKLPFKPFVIIGGNELPLVAHIPHAGLLIPQEHSTLFQISPSEIQQQKNLLTDWDTDAIFCPIAEHGGRALISKISRLVMDPERYADPDKEPMTKRGMGVVYTHGSHLQRIKRDPTPQEHQSIIDTLYRPYHEALNQIVEESRAKHGFCVIIDGHSYSPQALPYEVNQEMVRPPICLGVNAGGTTPGELVEIVRGSFTEAGLEVGINEPFSGSILPSGVSDLTNIYSIMIEINRSVYMNDEFDVLPTEVENLKAIITTIVEKSKHLNLAE